MAAIPALAAPRETPPTTFPVEAEIVHVEVTVTDKRGRPVSGLGVGDLVLYQDGRVVPIVNFRPPVAEGVSRPAAPPTAGAAGSTAVPAPTVEPVTFVVYIDNWNLTSADRARVLSGLASFLKEQLAHGGARALVVAARHEARVLSRLTADAEEVAAALRTAQHEPAHGDRTLRRAAGDRHRQGLDREPRPRRTRMCRCR